LPSVVFVSSRRRILPVIVALVLAAGVVLTFVSSAMLSLILILVLFLLIYECRSMPFVVISGGAVGGTLVFLPRGVRDRFLGLFRDLSTPDLGMLRGVGRDTVSRILFSRGEGMFSKASATWRLILGTGHRGVYALHPYFADLSVSFTYESYHFFQVLLVDYGIVGVVVCALFFFLIVQNCFSVLAMSKEHGKSLFAYIGIVLVSSLTFFGFFHYVWYDVAAMATFFSATALVCAAMRHDRMRRETLSPHEEYGSPAAEMDYCARKPRAAKE